MRLALHIFRKDARCFWYESLLVLLLTGLWMLRPSDLHALSIVLIVRSFSAVLVPIAWILLILRVMQEDPFPGNDYDWRIRPIPRGSLLLAKGLFIAAFVLLPFAALCTALVVQAGFDPLLYGGGFTSHLLCFLVTVVLPTAAVGTITGSVTAGGFSTILLVAPLSFVSVATMHGIHWFQVLLLLLSAVLWSAMVISIQFRGPSIWLARVAAYLALPLTVLLVALLPFDVGAAAHRLVAGSPPNLDAVRLELTSPHTESGSLKLYFIVQDVPESLPSSIVRMDGRVRTVAWSSSLRRHDTPTSRDNSLGIYTAELPARGSGRIPVDIEGTAWIAIYRVVSESPVHVLSERFDSTLAGTCRINPSVAPTAIINIGCMQPFRSASGVCLRLRDKRRPDAELGLSCAAGEFTPLPATFGMPPAVTNWSLSGIDINRPDDFVIVAERREPVAFVKRSFHYRQVAVSVPR